MGNTLWRDKAVGEKKPREAASFRKTFFDCYAYKIESL